MIILGEEICRGDIVSVKVFSKRGRYINQEIFFVERCKNEFVILNNYLYSISVLRSDILKLKVIKRGLRYQRKERRLKELGLKEEEV